MKTIDRIIERLPHDSGCATEKDRYWLKEHPRCDCPRAELVAYLERLKEPTDRMKREAETMWSQFCSGSSKDAAGTLWQRMLAKAEEPK